MEKIEKISQKEKENIKTNSNTDTSPDALKDFKKEFKRNQPSLFIARVPEPTLSLFKDIARTEYSGDYGMFLKGLLDYYINDIRYNDLLVRLFSIEEKVDKLYIETGLSSKSDIIAKTIGGRVLRKQKKEEAAK